MLPYRGKERHFDKMLTLIMRRIGQIHAKSEILGETQKLLQLPMTERVGLP